MFSRKNFYVLIAIASLTLTGFAQNAPTSFNPSDDAHTGPAVESKGNRIFLNGKLGQLTTVNRDAGASGFEAAAHAFLNGLVSQNRNTDHGLEVSRSKVDELGLVHIRFQQYLRGLPVVGAEVILHAEFETGEIYAVNGLLADISNLAREATLPANQVLKQAMALGNLRNAEALSRPELTYVLDHNGAAFLAWSLEIAYDNEDGPQLDQVFVDASGNDQIVRHPQHHYAKNRRTYNGYNGTSLPGTLVRSEGQGAVGNAAVDAAHNNAGVTYDYYWNTFSRDSYNGGGATLHSTAHHRNGYNNAYWSGSQMVYGDGDGYTFTSFSLSLDVVAHELTHAVTDSESDLIYSYESGALNEAMSDIFGAAAERYANGGVINSNTWKIGEDIYTPGTSGDAMRYMNDPRLAGDYDYYPTRYTGSADNGGVHTNSGIANLAFYLLSQGGTHPRGTTSVNVTAIGFDKAAAIFYRANTVYLTASSNFQAARNATAAAASDLYGQTEVNAVHEAWDAVGVPGSGGGNPGNCSGTEYTGTLSGTGAESFEPNGTYYYAGSGNHSGVLEGAGSDFDLYLWKWNGGSWSTVASSTSPDSTESVSYNGSAGYYAWRVHAYSGGGGYTLCLDVP